LCGLDQTASTALVQRFSKEQPFLMLYLYAQDEQIGGQDEDASIDCLDGQGAAIPGRKFRK
jgi:hypothetical protein